MDKSWIMLFLAFISQLGGFMSMNFPSYVYLQILDIFEINSVQFSLIFSVISFPNIFIPFFAGVVSSKYIGPRNMHLLTTFSSVLGATLCTIGFYLKLFEVLLIGRFFVGVGDTNVHIAQNDILTKWFAKKELSLPFSILGACRRAGVFLVAFLFSFYQDKPLYMIGEPLIIINFICLLSFLSSNAFVYIDKNYDYELQDQSEKIEQKQDVKTKQEENNKSSFTLKELPTLLWIIAVFQGINASMNFPFFNNIQYVIKQKYDLSGKFTVYIQTIPIILTSLLTPIYGLIQDKYGKIPIFLTSAGFIAMIGYFIQYSDPGTYIQDSHFESVLPIVIIGLVSGIYFSTAQSSISLIVKQEIMGEAIGICLSVINFTLVIYSSLVGYMLDQDSHQGYKNVGLMYIITCMIQMSLAITIYFFDQKNSKKLYNPKVKQKQK